MSKQKRRFSNSSLNGRIPSSVSLSKPQQNSLFTTSGETKQSSFWGGLTTLVKSLLMLLLAVSLFGWLSSGGHQVLLNRAKSSSNQNISNAAAKLQKLMQRSVDPPINRIAVLSAIAWSRLDPHLRRTVRPLMATASNLARRLFSRTNYNRAKTLAIRGVSTVRLYGERTNRVLQVYRPAVVSVIRYQFQRITTVVRRIPPVSRALAKIEQVVKSVTRRFNWNL